MATKKKWPQHDYRGEWGKIARLPQELKQEFDRRLREGGFGGHLELADWLGQQGYHISKQAIHRYGQKFEQRLEAIRLATEQAREVCAQFPDDDESLQKALIKLVQFQLFEVLIAANERVAGERAAIAPVNMTAMARSVGGLLRAQTLYEQARERTREKVAVVEEKLEEAKEKGLSVAKADEIRKVLMEIEP